MTALHWNTTHFEKDFESTYLNAIDGYKKISQERDVAVHSPKNQLQNLEKYKTDGHFSLASFKEASLPRSWEAAHRESLTTHVLESLEKDTKGTFRLNFCAENRLSQTYQKRLILLNQEASQNSKLQIWITSRHA